MGLGGLIVLAIIGWVFFKNPLALLDQGGGQSAGPTQSQRAGAGRSGAESLRQRDPAFDRNRPGARFSRRMARRTSTRTWHLFSGGVNTACGGATTAVGPFYCPGDQKVYLDLAFFQQLQDELHSAGDFARAYVIAHEVGHHVQKLTGVFDKVDEARRRGAPMDGADGLSVRQELQADCYAGIWANHSQQELQLAAARRHRGGRSMPPATLATTPCSSRRRVRSARYVYPRHLGAAGEMVQGRLQQSGDMAQCNTFAGSL